jgi:glycosyltransferase involved in cell wall biosynthesis
MDSRIVVLIPAYNSSATIGATLKSLAAQGKAVEDLEGVWVADDCSTDTTVERCLGSWNEQVPLHVMPLDHNVGQQPNVNRAFDGLRTEADWVLVLHADDMVKPGWLAALLHEIDVADEHVASVCASWDNLFSDGRIEPGEDDPGRGTQTIRGTPQSVRDTLLRGCWWHISGCAIRVAAFVDVGPFDASIPYMADWDWLLRCLGRGWTINYVPRPLVLYRLHSQSVAAVSLRVDRDIHESLRIVGRFSRLLSGPELANFHLRRAVFAVRRLLRALEQRQPGRFWSELRTLILIGRNMNGCFRTRIAN